MFSIKDPGKNEAAASKCVLCQIFAGCSFKKKKSRVKQLDSWNLEMHASFVSPPPRLPPKDKELSYPFYLNGEGNFYDQGHFHLSSRYY